MIGLMYEERKYEGQASPEQKLLQELGGKLPLLDIGLPLAKQRMRTAYNKAIEEADNRWTYFDTPDFNVIDDAHGQEPRRVSFHGNDPNGTTRPVARVSNQAGEEVWFNLPDTSRWIEQYRNNHDLADDPELRGWLAAAEENQKEDATTMPIVLISAAPYPDPKDGPNIPHDFRVAYALDDGTAQPLEGSIEQPESALREAVYMADCLIEACKAAIGGDIVATRRNGDVHEVAGRVATPIDIHVALPSYPTAA